MLTLSCLHCAAEDCVRVGLDADHQFTCTECDAEWTAADVRERLAAWQRVLAWIDTSPFVTDQPAAEAAPAEARKKAA